MADTKPRQYDEDYNASHDFCYGCNKLKGQIRVMGAGMTPDGKLSRDESLKLYQKVLSDVNDEFSLIRSRIDLEKPELSEVQRLSVVVITQIAAVRTLCEEFDLKLKALAATQSEPKVTPTEAPVETN
ncbi:molybdenum cofactor synthesis C [Caudoviricetes sp.]|nr:molybdenum cofactor synthesis C [Caudoviricetes sp.]